MNATDIKQMRKEYKVSPLEVAREIGCYVNWIEEVERGEIDLSFDEFMELAAILVTIAVSKRGDLRRRNDKAQWMRKKI